MKKWSFKAIVAVSIAFLCVIAELGILVFNSQSLITIPEQVTRDPTSSPTPGTGSSTRTPLTGRLVFSAEQNGQWDLYAAVPDSVHQKLTSDGLSRAPAITRDGTRIAFESHRDGNWEVYVIDSTGAPAVRLTRGAAFDGRPSWSPDGRRIAFSSMRQDDLDIWVMNADGTDPQDLTRDSPAVDHAPTWSPDGRWIAFTSWRTNTAQIWVVSPDGKETINLSKTKSNDQSPAWSPDGKYLAFVSDRDGQRAIYVAEFSSSGLNNTRRVTFSGWDDMPTWSPDGKYLAFVSPRPSRQPVYVVPVDGGIPAVVGDGPLHAHSIAWADSIPSNPLGVNGSPSTALVEPPASGTAKLIPLKDVYLAPSYGQMSDRVSGSFLALRSRTKAEAGWDFLSVLSDMTRQLTGECGEGCEVLSWHKAGRAADTRMSVNSAGVPLMEIVREDQLGGTYWRIFLRAARQDGTLGEPLTEPPWDWTYDARWKAAPGQGGTEKAIPAGYYIDFTELAREYGWNRISSFDDQDLSWKENITAMEFWHYQKTDGLTWYPALRELYPDQALEAAFDYNALRRRSEDAYLLYLKGIPAPAAAWKWYALSP